MTNDKKSETNAAVGSSMGTVSGTVKWYNEQKGYGFIEQENGKDLFVHYTAIRGKLRQGDKVQYELGEGKKGPCATKVRVVEGLAASEGAASDVTADTASEASKDEPKTRSSDPEAQI